MKIETKTLYICDFCGCEFCNEDTCKKHEQEHIIPDHVEASEYAYYGQPRTSGYVYPQSVYVTMKTGERVKYFIPDEERYEKVIW